MTADNITKQPANSIQGGVNNQPPATGSTAVSSSDSSTAVTSLDDIIGKTADKLPDSTGITTVVN